MPELSVHDALNYALRCHQKGLRSEAETIYRQILEVVPNQADAWHYLGIIHHQRGDWAGGIEHVRRAIELNPQIARYHSTLGTIYLRADRLEDAELCCRRAIDLEPKFVEALENLGKVLFARGETAEAQCRYVEAATITGDPIARFNAAVMLPAIYRSSEEVRAWRTSLLKNLSELTEAGVELDPTKGPRDRSDLFYLAYQGQDDRRVHENCAAMCVASGRDYVQSRASRHDHRSKFRVGFISPHFYTHTIGKVYGGVISHLPRKRIEVAVLSLGTTVDFVTENLKAHTDRFVTLPPQRTEACQAIANLDLDVLVYTDIGMHPSVYALALSRLAPVQCLMWGHPVTSGLPTMDYFISSELMESPEADEHYTEELIRLKSIGVYHERPQLPAPAKTRQELGLPPSANLYGCLQSPFKLLPDFDQLLAAILRRDPEGMLVLTDSYEPNWSRLLARRLERTIPDVYGRIQWFPWMSFADYLQLVNCIDVLLLPSSFGGGSTSYEALALGTPIVTLPSQLLRGRITYGLYRRMGVLDCVAGTPEEFVDIAVKLGTDRLYRDSVRQSILSANDVLFEDMDAVTELEALLVGLAQRARGHHD